MIDSVERERRTRAFVALHERGAAFVLPNAWDGASARVLESANFPAIATTSAGVAYTLGYGDKQRVSFEELCTLVERLAVLVGIPISVDMEAGYAHDTHSMVRNVEVLVGLGAVGINLEDVDHRTGELLDIDVQCARIAAIASAMKAHRTTLFINARTDIVLLGVGDETTRVERSIERLRAYVEAGASGVFLPGLRDDDSIGRVCASIDAPFNVLVSPGLAPIDRLRALGVARVSTGSGPIRRTLGALRELADEMRDDGTFGWLDEPTIAYAEMEALLA